MNIENTTESTSVNNFGQLYYYDKTADDAERHEEIIPLYALSNLLLMKKLSLQLISFGIFIAAIVTRLQNTA